MQYCTPPRLVHLCFWAMCWAFWTRPRPPPGAFPVLAQVLFPAVGVTIFCFHIMAAMAMLRALLAAAVVTYVRGNATGTDLVWQTLFEVNSDDSDDEADYIPWLYAVGADDEMIFPWHADDADDASDANDASKAADASDGNDADDDSARNDADDNSARNDADDDADNGDDADDASNAADARDANNASKAADASDGNDADDDSARNDADDNSARNDAEDDADNADDDSARDADDDSLGDVCAAKRPRLG